MRAWRYISTYC